MVDWLWDRDFCHLGYWRLWIKEKHRRETCQPISIMTWDMDVFRGSRSSLFALLFAFLFTCRFIFPLVSCCFLFPTSFWPTLSSSLTFLFTFLFTFLLLSYSFPIAPCFQLLSVQPCLRLSLSYLLSYCYPISFLTFPFTFLLLSY